MARLALVLSLAVLSAQPALALQRMDERVAACAACHGEQGRSQTEHYYPSIAGKPAQYLFNQLRHFRDGRRANVVMAGLLAQLDDDYLRHMADYYAAQTPKLAAREDMPDQQAAARAQRLVKQGDTQARIPACTKCHGEQLHGRLPAIPGLIGLSAEYISAQMGAWREGVRRSGEPDCMAEIARRMSAQQITEVSAWFAGQAASQTDRPAPASQTALPMNCFAESPAADQHPSGAGDQAMAQRGEYLLRAGNCIGCHTRRGDQPLAGGRAIQTPFGTVYSSNLTPDDETGIGSWTADNFWKALHEGISADGRLLYPAFPYTHYSLITRADSDAMLAYLKTLSPQIRPAQPHKLRFPFNTQMALRVWRWLYFTPQSYQPDPQRSERWNRGRYLVEGLGHCSACHGERNALGALQASRDFAGSLLPDQLWYAPPLKAANNAADKADLFALLKHGTSAQRVASGPMGEVVANSLQHLDTDDLEAMLEYLASQASVAPTKVASLRVNARLREQQMQDGEALYAQHCAGCHGDAGQGEDRVYPPLRGNELVLTATPGNAIRVVKFGGYAPSTQGNPYPFGMPPFAHQLNAPEIASVLTYIRNAWGNQASAVSPVEVAR